MTEPLTVERNRVVEFSYELRSTSGELLEHTQPGSPRRMLYGHGGLLPGLEKALHGKPAGPPFEVVLSPAEAFGERKEDHTQRLSKKYFEHPKKLRPGMTAVAQTKDGARPVTVLKVGSKVVDVDLNHPRAGETLAFTLEILSVRAAAPEELAHGHAH